VEVDDEELSEQTADPGGILAIDLPPQSQAGFRLKEIGRWLDHYGESIYGTRGGPFRRGLWGAATYKDNTIYVHLLDPELDTVVLPPIQRKIIASYVLTGGTARIDQNADSVRIAVPKPHRQEIDTIVAMKLDGLAAQANPGRLLSGSAAYGKKVSASSVFHNDHTRRGVQNVIDDDPDTYWAADADLHPAWLQVDLGAPRDIERTEAYFVRPAAGQAYTTLEYKINLTRAEYWLSVGARPSQTVQSFITKARKAGSAESPAVA